MSLISRYIGVNIILQLGKSNILIAVYEMYGKLWGDDIINSLICIFILTGQEMFLENLRNFKVS